VTRYLFLAGKGGVGKTTCAAASALLAARRERTLLVSTDPAHSLGDALGVRLGAAPRAVSARLFAAELDADRALSRWLKARERSFRRIAARGTYLDEEDIDALFRLSLPGVDELVGLLELRRLSAGYERVVVDTAPTGHTLRLLEMPQTLARLAGVLDDLQGKHRALSLSLRGSVRRDAEDAVIEELSQSAGELQDLLRSDEAEFQWVTLPEDLAFAEARDGVQALQAAGMRVSGLIANRVTPAPRGKCALCSARRAEESRVLREAASLALPVTAVPAQEREPRGLPALRKVAAALRRPALGHLTKTVKTTARAAPGSGLQAPGWTELVVPAGVRLVFFGGKGGVGKTTAAATAALAFAGRGARVLLLSTDPAHSLSDVLGVQVSDAEREIAPGLRARELDATAAFGARRDQYRAAVDELFEALRGGSAFDAPYDRAVMQDLIELSPPGLDELFGLLAVIEALQRHDVVVVDTAPTGHALRLLQLVSTAREWLQVLLQILLKYRPVTGLGHLAKDVTGTARELREFEALLHDSARARFVVVTRAAALPCLETVRLLAALRCLRIAVPAVLVNALTPPGCPRCRRAARDEAHEIGALRKARRGWVMLGAPATVPAPHGPEALRRFGSTWATIE
jgi:arsenite/tail-anchored protein-transporting ATPase